MNASFEHYKIFYFVAKYKNLTRAASALSTSQPSITRTIRNLENELGCRLFIRAKTGVELTPEGKLFYDYISSGCEQFFKGVSELSSMISLENGTLYISATETALHCFLFEAMEKFNELYPKVQFKILNNSTKESVQALKDGKIDLAVVSAPCRISNPLKIKKLCEYHEILIGGKRFAKLSESPKALHELTDYPWISLLEESITRMFHNEYFEACDLKFSPDIEVATTDMILSTVRHNLGIGFIPDAFSTTDLAAGTIYQIPLAAPMPSRDINIIYDTEYPHSIASKAFLKFLSESYH